MKKVLQSSLLVVLFLGLSNPAKACDAYCWKETIGILGIVGASVLGVGTVAVNGVASVLSGSARSATDEKIPASDQKDTIKEKLLGGTVTYAVSAAAGFVALSGLRFYETMESGTAHRLIGISGGLAVVASAIGMGFNGMAYHLADAISTDSWLNPVLGTSIAGISLNAVSAGILTYMFFKNRANPANTGSAV
jgi:hypothetical protein